MNNKTQKVKADQSDILVSLIEVISKNTCVLFANDLLKQLNLSDEDKKKADKFILSYKHNTDVYAVKVGLAKEKLDVKQKKEK